MEEETQELVIKNKTNIFNKIGFFLLLLFILIYIDFHFIEPEIITVEEYAITSNKITENYNGLKIVQFSDIQFGRITNEKELKKVVTKINETKPDIIVFTGDMLSDYITLSDDNKNFLKDTLKELNASLGKYAVTGDKDYTDIDFYKELCETAGFKILNKETVPIYYKGNTPIYITGVASLQEEKDMLWHTESNNNYQILLAHEPIRFNENYKYTDLTLSGHSMGGIIRIPFLNGILKDENSSTYEKGRYDKENSTLFVNPGIGSDKINGRFLNHPTIYLYRLYNQGN